MTTSISSNSTPTLSETSSRSLLTRITRLLYAISCYAISMAGLMYFILFISDLHIPVSIHSQEVSHSLGFAVMINFGLLLLFGVQHSVMARKKFKKRLSRYIDPSIERATFCLATGLVMILICYAWVPIQGNVFTVESDIVSWIVRGIGITGWMILVIATFQLDHFELFGLRQAYFQLLQKPLPEISFQKNGFYKIVRHPIQTGILIGMWFVPTVSPSYLMLAGGMTVYIFIGLYFEEKDLIKEFGQTYRDYIKEVGKILPFG